MSPGILYSALGATIISISFYAGVQGDASLNFCFLSTLLGITVFACAFGNFDNPNGTYTGPAEAHYLQCKIEQAETILNQHEVPPVLQDMAQVVICRCKRQVGTMEFENNWSPLRQLEIYRLPEDIAKLVAGCPRKLEQPVA